MRIYEHARQFSDRTAICSGTRQWTYHQLCEAAERTAGHLLETFKVSDLLERRIAFLITPGFNYVAAQWGIWQAGGIAVPLCPEHPVASLTYPVEAAGANALISDQANHEKSRQVSVSSLSHFLDIDTMLSSADKTPLPEIADQRRAMILFTSGTTNKPKGVVTSHAILESQIRTLVKAWQWTSDDRILNVLPLHHVHGIINVVSCALWSGATCCFLPQFSAGQTWQAFGEQDLTLFMAVPTIYYKLIAYWDEQSSAEQARLSATAAGLRLMVSGSAALPVPTLERWRAITSHTLLERYGMTEIGMALSNPYDGQRRPGHVGLPLPGVELRLVDENNTSVQPGVQGEIQIKGPNVFLEYWENAPATGEAFIDGWFRTGDIAVLNNGSYRILGRNSVDIIKSGGYKISALEIEETLRKHPAIDNCAVVGLPDVQWGEIVSVALVGESTRVSSQVLKEWMREHLPSYQVPRIHLWMSELPRNTLGKVTKKEVVRILQDRGHGFSD